MENSGAGVGEGQAAGVEGSGLQSTGASQHATGTLDHQGTSVTLAICHPLFASDLLE